MNLKKLAFPDELKKCRYNQLIDTANGDLPSKYFGAKYLNINCDHVFVVSTFAVWSTVAVFTLGHFQAAWAIFNVSNLSSTSNTKLLDNSSFATTWYLADYGSILIYTAVLKFRNIISFAK